MQPEKIRIASGWAAKSSGDRMLYFRDGEPEGMELTAAIRPSQGRPGVLAAVRKSRRETQAEVAAKMGVSRVSEARWECGLDSPAPQRHDRLNDYLTMVWSARMLAAIREGSKRSRQMKEMMATVGLREAVQVEGLSPDHPVRKELEAILASLRQQQLEGKPDE